MKSGDLTPEEKRRLKELEALVEKGRKAYKVAGDAIREIRLRRLHRPLTFTEYVRKKWSRSYNWARDLERWASVIDSLNEGETDTAVAVTDISQRAARFLATLRSVAKRKVVVKKAREIAGPDADLTQELLRKALSATLRRRKPGRVEVELRHGRFQDHAPPPGTAALALLDVPYTPTWNENFPALAQWVFDALRPGGRCLMYLGHTQLPTAMAIFNERLSYVWLLSRMHNHAGGFVYPLGAASKTTLILVHQKVIAPLTTLATLGMMDVVPAGKEPCLFHEFEKPVDELAKMIELSTEPGDLVVDATMGSGSCGAACLLTSRRFFGVEVSKQHYDTACKRVGFKKRRGRAA